MASISAPIIYLRVIQFLWIIGTIAASLAFAFSYKEANWGFIALSLGAILGVWGLQVTIRGFKERMHWAWTIATILTAFGVASILFPFAIYTLIRLLNSSVSSQFKSSNNVVSSSATVTNCPECNKSSLSFNNIGNRQFCSCGWSQERPEVSKNIYKQWRLNAVTSLASAFFLALSSILAIALFEKPHNPLLIKNISKSRFEVNNQTMAQLKGFSNSALRDKSQECLNNRDQGCLVAVYSELTKREPGNIMWPANLAFTLTELGYHEQAVSVYASIANLPESTYDIMAYYGTSLQNLGQHEEAIYWFRKALAINTKLVDITRSLAISLINTGQEKEAKEVITVFVKKYPESRNYFKDIAVNLATIEFKAPETEL